MKTLICDCNRTMPLDVTAIRQALSRHPAGQAEGLEGPYTLLCRREAGAFQRAAKTGDELLVACTQEARLFRQLNDETEGAPTVAERPIRFVNLRETGGWSRDAAQATPKLAALLAAAQLPPPEPVGTVAYRSSGRCLVIGPADTAQRAAERLSGPLEPVLLVQGVGAALPQRREQAVHAGRLTRLSGWLGAFEADPNTEDHIDFELEVMRYLIAGDDVAVCNLERQRRFFRAHLQTWVESFCDAVAAHPRAGWLAALADFTRAFIQVEAQAFDLIE